MDPTYQYTPAHSSWLDITGWLRWLSPWQPVITEAQLEFFKNKDKSLIYVGSNGM